MAASKRALTSATRPETLATHSLPGGSRREARRRVFALVLVLIMVVSTLGALVYAIVGGL